MKIIIRIILFPFALLYNLPRLIYFYIKFKKEMREKAQKIVKKYGMDAGVYFIKSTNISFLNYLKIIANLDGKKPTVKINYGRQRKKAKS